MTAAQPPSTTLTVNGVARTLTVDPETALVLALRWELDLRGVRVGCAQGFCGVCTVLVDGQPVRACSTPLQAVAGRQVETPEALGTPAAPGRVQRLFLEEQAAQCGYCINGITMTVEAACRQGGMDDAALRLALSAHLCRCGTHQRILHAARRALAGEDARLPGPRAAQGHPVLEDEVEVVTAPSRWGQEPPPDDRVEARLALRADGRVEVRPGKVELGQGITAALAQIAAAQIGVPLEAVTIAPVRTSESPDEGTTSGSQSVEVGGLRMAMAAVAFRRLLLARASAALDLPPSLLQVRGTDVVGDGGRSVALAALAAEGPLTGPVLPIDVPDWRRTPVAQPAPRLDLAPKVTGAPAFVHDLALPGMVHARAVLPPVYDARLEHVDEAAAEALPGVLRVVRDGRLLLVIAAREHQAVRAAAALAATAAWQVAPLPDGESLFAAMRSWPAERYVAAGDPTADPQLPGSIRATYTQPYVAHGPVAPSAAVALASGHHLVVWSHTQGVFPLRRELAALLGLAETDVEVRHLPGPGCYGQTLSDDAAAFAALAAAALPGRPVRFQMSSTDEFTWDLFGPAMLADLSATLSAGRIQRWQHRSITDSHNGRPRGSGTDLMAAWLRDDLDRPWRGASSAGARNAVPLYDLPAVTVVADHVRGPLRTSTLRSLGSYLNTFAAESFIDELAEVAGADPLAFRLAHLTDARARRVLETAADAAGWRAHVGPSGRGLGLALCRYKDTKAYVAQAVQVDVDLEAASIRVLRIITVCDAGAVISLDGLRNQLEGGTLQGLSRALHEQVRFDAAGVRTTDWESYRVLGFAEVPPVEVIVLEPEGDWPPLGAGEAATPPLPAALANAINDACGVRLRDLPFSPDRIRAASAEV